MRNQLLCKFGLVLVCLILLSACGDDKKNTAASTSSTDAHNAQVKKWNTYADLFNKIDSVTNLCTQYFASLGTASEPEINQKRISTGDAVRAMSIDTIAKASEAALRAVDAKPVSDLDPIVRDYCQALRELTACLRESREYYTAKGYVDDNYARGKKIHTRMLAVVPDVASKGKAFENAMHAQNLKNQKDGVASMRAEGMRVVPAAIDFTIAANELLDELQRQDLNEDSVYKLDTAAFTPFYDRLLTSLATLEKEGKNSQQVDKESLFEGRVTTLVSAAREVKGAAAGIKERAALGEPERLPNGKYRKQKGPGNPPEEFDRLLKLYIDEYNRLIAQRKN